jgi:ribonuclease R
MLASGSMYVKVSELENDIFVDARNGGNALNGDTVEVKVIRQKRDGHTEGEIVRIIERSSKSYVGVLDVTEHAVFMRPISRKIPVDIYIKRDQTMHLESGQKVVVKIVDWIEGSKSPVGEIVDILGQAGDNDTEMHAIMAEFDLPYNFEPQIEESADAIAGEITEEERAARRDFRGVTTFTIDPEDAKDFDDALSIRKLSDGLGEIGVHIADVTHYVQPGSVVDTEGESRATSVYLVDRTIPMLPERLAIDFCSLRPHEE